VLNGVEYTTPNHLFSYFLKYVSNDNNKFICELSSSGNALQFKSDGTSVDFGVNPGAGLIITSKGLDIFTETITMENKDG
jgi:hypothetical protein